MKHKTYLSAVSLASITVLIFSSLGCADAGKNTGIGTAVGATAGAAVGAIIGHQSGNRTKGALVGAALGGAIGGVHGHKLDKQAKELEKVAETQRTEQGILTKLKGDILFPSGSASLKAGALVNVDKISSILKKYPENRIQVIGHTDSTGRKESNSILSEQRAQAVKMQMVRSGVPESAISTVGMGDSQPVASNASSEGRSQNRRVELVITMPE
ncbi:MAG: OmpA family protein, partial [Bdellovibrionales bacterium]|nr:OmpA family protein [Bdellovibrionales bacterium]